MKKIRMFLLLVIATCVSAISASAAEDCRILSVENKAIDSWQIKLNLADLPVGEMFFKGQESPDGAWVSYPASIVAGVGVVNMQWPVGEFIEFSYGTKVDGVEHWADPDCSSYLFNGHFRVQLGKKRAPVALPSIAVLLLNKKTPPPPPPIVHTCAVISVVESGVSGDLADYAITLSLQQFTNAPSAAVPFVSRQSAPNSAWTGFSAVARQGDTAILIVTSWPRSSAMEFAYKLVADSTDYWQDISSWQTDTCTVVWDGHFRVMLGN
jgi:hypothetical protein